MFEFDEKDYRDIIDPRDDVLGTFHYWHPTAVPVEAQVNGVLFSKGASAIEQLVVVDLITSGLLADLSDGSLALTQEGFELVEKRLDKWPAWGDYAVRPDAPPLPPIGKRLLIALKTENFHRADKPFQKFLDSI